MANDITPMFSFPMANVIKPMCVLLRWQMLALKVGPSQKGSVSQILFKNCRCLCWGILEQSQSYSNNGGPARCRRLSQTVCDIQRRPSWVGCELQRQVMREVLVDASLMSWKLSPGVMIHNDEGQWEVTNAQSWVLMWCHICTRHMVSPDCRSHPCLVQCVS